MIVGTGHYLPEKVLTNADLEKMVDTSDEWIITRTGIRERRICSPEQTTSEISAAAALKALEKADLDPSDVELIITGTINPDMKFPSASVFVQERIGNTKGTGFDLGAACAGFVYSMTVADSMIGSGRFNNAVVIGTEILSRVADWKDRKTCVLFGDGSGAIVLKKSDGKRGLLSSVLHSDGRLAHLLYYKGEGTKYGSSKETIEGGFHFLRMNGQEVFKHAVREMGEASLEAIDKAGLKPDDIDLMIPHQANIRIIDATARRLGFTNSRVMVNIDRTGNTSSASIPIAMDQAVEAGRLEPGMNVLMAVFGAGLIWGAAVVKF